MWRMIGVICCVVLVAGLSPPVWAQGLVDISCESIPCGGGGGGGTYQYTLKNVSGVDLILTDFCPGTDDLVVGNYSNWIAPAGFTATVADWATLPPSLSAMFTTGVQTPHGSFPPGGGPQTAGGVHWQGNIVLQTVAPNDTATFGFDNPNTYEDVEWQVETSAGPDQGVTTDVIAGPAGVFTHGWIHAPTAEGEEPPIPLLEFSLDIGSDTELSDPFSDVDEGFDPGDVFQWQSAPVVNYNPAPWGLRDGFKDDSTIFVGFDPGPDPPDMNPPIPPGPPSTAVPVGWGTVDYVTWFDLDGHDQLGVSLWETYYLEGYEIDPIEEWASQCIHSPEFLMISFDDDSCDGWPSMGPNFDVPVDSPSPGGVVSYGMTANRDEVIGITLGPMPWPAPVMSRYPIASEVMVHQDLQPNPDDGTDRDDDDVDSLDVVPESEEPTQPICPNWYFSPDHEATEIDPNNFPTPLDPGDIYEVWPGFGPILVVDDVNNLGVPNSTDVDAFEFVFMTNPEINPPVLQPSLAVLFSVDDDDTLTPPDESGGLMPNAIYGSFLNGMYFLVVDPVTAPELDDDIDALTVWVEEIYIPPPPPVIVRAQSHKLHPGLYGYPNVDYGVNMTTSCNTTGVEGRANGPTRLQFEFDVNVDISGASVVLSTGALGAIPYSQPGPKILEVAVTGLFRQQPLPGCWVQVDISGVTAGGTPMVAATHWIKSMYGDINNDAWADGSDIVAAKVAGLGITGNGADPRVDLNVDGWTDGSDIVEAKLSTVSTVWPACP